jgi:lipopolysaccharide export system protein LptC
MGSAGHTLARALRLGLPLSALVLLSTVFLVSGNLDPNNAAALSGMDPAQITREPRIAAARFAGVMRDQTAITVSAQSVRSQNTDVAGAPLVLDLIAAEGVLDFPDDSAASFTAETAQLDQAAGLLTAQGPVILENSAGYVLEMGRMEATLDQTRLSGRDGIKGDAPAGQIEADSLDLTRTGGTDGGYLLAFTGNVRLLYTP